MQQGNLLNLCAGTETGALVNNDGCSEIQLDIDDWEIINNLKIYPNPTKDLITLDGLISEEVTIQVYTTTGSRIISKNLFVNNGSVVFSLKNYPVGVYIVKVIGNKNETAEFKVLKK